MSRIWQETTLSLGTFYLLLALFSLCVALLAAGLLRKRFSDSYGIVLLLFWTLNMAAPIIGSLATLWLVYYLLSVRYEEVLTETNTIDMSEFYSDFPRVQRIFGEGSMHEILSNEEISGSLKMKALVSLAENTRKNEISLIKNALSDRNDEIRLYSFAIIDRLERNINNRIHLMLDEYNKLTGAEKRAEAAGKIAHLYWEMLYFELTDEDLKQFIAREVDRYASEALEKKPDDPSLNTLLGKCCLMTGQYRRARRYFETILTRFDILKNSITPYLAELYFIKHDYRHVRELMHDADGLRSNQLLNPIIEIWNEKESE